MADDRQREIVIERRLFSQQDFDKEHSYPPSDYSPLNIRDVLLRNCECSLNCFLRFLKMVFPFYGIMKKYKYKVDLPSDVIAGLTVAIMVIPQSMAYSLLATLPPVYGLYVSFFPVIIYFFLGSSRHISIGTFAVTSLMVGAVADKGFSKHNPTPRSDNATTSPPTTISPGLFNNVTDFTDGSTRGGNVVDPIRLQYAMIVTFVAGLIQMLMGVCRLGFIMTYLSQPVISAFTTAAAFHVFISQISHIFGLTLQRNNGLLKFPKTLIDVFKHITETNLTTLAISAVAIATLFLVKECINKRFKNRLKIPVPIELIVVAVMTVASYFLSLSKAHGVATVGFIAKGIPAPNVPHLALFAEVITDAIALAIVGFAVNISLAKILSRDRYDINANQELVASGSCNLIGSFFNSFFSSASLSRSLVQESVGGKTQVAGLVSCCILVAVLLEIGPYFSYLPKVLYRSSCILAAIVIVNLKGMFLQFEVLPEMWRTSKYDFATWVVTWLASVILDIDIGLGIGLLFSFLTVLVRTQRAPITTLGRVPHTDLYRDIALCATAREIPGVKIVRFESSLYFINAEYFKQKLFEICEVDPRRELKRREKLEKKRVKAEKLEKRKGGTSPTDKNNLDTISPRVPIQSTASDSASRGDEPVLYAYTDIRLALGTDPQDARTSVAAESCSSSITRRHSQDTGLPSSNTASRFSSPTNSISHLCHAGMPLHHVIVDCSMLSFLDSVGVKVLVQVISDFGKIDIPVFLASCQTAVRNVMERSTFYDTVSKGALFLTVHDAVVWALARDSNQLNQGTVSQARAVGKILTDVHYSANECVNNDDREISRADTNEENDNNNYTTQF